MGSRSSSSSSSAWRSAFRCIRHGRRRPAGAGIDGNLSLLSVPQRFFNGINSFPLMAVPFFIFAADLMSASAITTAILRFTKRWSAISAAASATSTC